MDEIDEALQRLATAPTHPRLLGLETRVLAQVHAASGGARMRDLSLAACSAILMGTLSVWVSSPAYAASPLQMASPLSPAALLTGAR